MVDILHKIFRKEHVQGPIKRDSHLFFYSRELKQVDRPPEPPGHKPGEVEAEDARNTRAPANRGKQAKRVESKRNQIFATALCDDVTRHDFAFPRGMLRCGWLKPTFDIWNHRT